MFVRDNLVLYLPFWKKDGVSFMDESAYGHLATVTTAKWTRQGRSFNSATPDYISCGNNPVLNFIGQDFTIEAWVKTSSNAGNPVIVCRGVHLSDGYFLYIDSTHKVNFLTEQSGAAQTTTSGVFFNTGKWHHIIVTRSGAVAKIYRNLGDATLTAGTHINPVTNTRNFKVGVLDDNSSQPMSGVIGEIRVYNKVLTVGERERNFLATKDLYA